MALRTHSAKVIVAGALAVELASTEVDVGSAIAVLPRLLDQAVGAGVSHIESNRLEQREHFGWMSAAESLYNNVAEKNILPQLELYTFRAWNDLGF